MINVFWGASKAGIACLNLWKAAGCSPDYFTCNDRRLFGKKLEEVPVVDPQRIIGRNDIHFYITSSSYDEIFKVLIQNKVEQSRITYLDLSYISSIPTIYSKLETQYKPKIIINLNKRKGVMLENIYGNALSGELTWINDLEAEFAKSEIPHEILIPSDNFYKAKYKTVSLERSKKSNLFYSACNYFLTCHYNTVVTRGGSEILAAACFVKFKFHVPLNIFVFSHKDFLPNYLDYCFLKKEINGLFVISNKIKKNFTYLDFPLSKIIYYPWEPTNIRSSACLNNNFDSPIKLVYVGRIVVSQKRCDLLLKLALILKTHLVNFKLYLAGIGDALESLKKFVFKNNLEKEVIFCGLIGRNLLNVFLDDKDVFVSCSESEGHSLAQFEALSRGLVAVVTDCSGVSDDVVDSYNGFICSNGNIIEMANQIIFLEKNRNILHQMKLNSISLFNKKKKLYLNPLLELVRAL